MGALILPLALFGIFYFVLIRPQQRQIKEQKAMVAKAGAGDRVMLTSGIFGTITEVVGDAVFLELADGIEILVSKPFIQETLDRFPTEEGPQDELEHDDDDEEFDELEHEEDDDEVDA